MAYLSLDYSHHEEGKLDMTDQVLEWAPFRLRSGVDEAALLESSERLQRDFLAYQEGFVRRELIKGAEGSYIDLIWWSSFAASQSAMKNADGARCAGATLRLWIVANAIRAMTCCSSMSWGTIGPPRGFSRWRSRAVCVQIESSPLTLRQAQGEGNNQSLTLSLSKHEGCAVLSERKMR